MKRILALCLAALLCILIAVLAIPRAFSGQDLNAALVETLQSASRQTVSIEGTSRLSLLPTPRIVVDDVTAQMNGTELFRAKRAVVSFKLLPLLLGARQADEIDLEGPRFTLTPNLLRWTALHRFVMANSELPNIFVTDGEATVLSARGISDITEINGSLGWRRPTSTVKLNGSFVWHGQAIQARFNLDDPQRVHDGQDADLSFEAHSALGDIEFEGKLAGATRVASGDLDLRSPSALALAHWLGAPAKAHGRLGALALEGTVEATGDRLTVSDADLTLDGNALSGVLIWSNIGTAKFEASLAAPTLDLTPYVTALRPMVGSALGWSRRTLHALPTSLPETEIRLSADRVKAGSLEFGNAAGSIRVRHGNLTLIVDELEAYGGSVAAHASYEPADDGGVHAGLSARIENVALADVLAGVDSGAMRGALTASLRIEGSGPDTFDLIKALNGQADLRIADGLVSGMDLAAAARAARREPLTAVSARGGTTAFTTLEGHLAVDNGIFQVENGKLSGDALTASLSGGIDLAQRHWALSGEALLAGDEPNAGPVPFRIEGPFGHPHFLPNGRHAVERSNPAPGSPQ